MGIKQFLFREERSQPDIVALYESGERGLVDYSAKENRADKITHQGIGSSKYGSGNPPTIYDKPIASVRAYPVVYSAITALSDSVAPLSIKAYAIKGGSRTELTDHPFYQVFARPNPQQGSFEFLEELEQSLDVCGNAFVAKEKAGGTYELYILNPKYVGIVPDPKIKVKEYRYYINGAFVTYKPEEIIHLKYHDVDDPYFGLPPLSTAAEILTFESNRLAFSNQFFLNGAIPAGVLETDGQVSDQVNRKLRGEWTNIHAGVKNSHKVAILTGGLKYRPITSPISELNFPALKQLSREDILSIFKMPESILGSQSGTGTSEGKAALTTFWRLSIIPRLKRIESGLNRGLAKELFGEGATSFEFNLTAVVALQEDKESQARYIKELIGASVMTCNEARQVVGLPPSKDPNADKLMVSNSFFGNALIPIDAAAAGGAGSTAEKPAAKPKT
jgi:HK97 family phage portal protein